MKKCMDFIKREGITKGTPLCASCVNHSDQYKDCKLHGDDQRTAIMHGKIKYSGGRKRMFK